MPRRPCWNFCFWPNNLRLMMMNAGTAISLITHHSVFSRQNACATGAALFHHSKTQLYHLKNYHHPFSTHLPAQPVREPFFIESRGFLSVSR